ncbi:MAG: flavin reductase family protein [Phenylobacterium sp.]|nr:flavin reductase family protein [Phenylobacterium sp.]
MAGQLVSAAANLPGPAEWRAAMGSFPSGVTVVTSWVDGAPFGSTVSAFSSVSLEPPLLLVCLDLKNPMCRAIPVCGVFGVNILGEDGQDLARRFAFTPEAERFEDLAFRAEGGGAPQLDAAPVFIDCVVHEIITAGDHLVIVGQGVRTDHRSATPPLVYHTGRMHKLPTAP